MGGGLYNGGDWELFGGIGASRPPGARGAAVQPYRLWGLRGPKILHGHIEWPRRI